jgi:hypothetical protein
MAAAASGMPGMTSQFRTPVKLNRSARSLRYRPERMTRFTWGTFSWSKSMSHSQLVSLVKYFRDTASTMMRTVQSRLVEAM